MKLDTSPYKGARDFFPEDKRLQKAIFAVLRKTAESFGYQEYDAPILEPLEIFAAKTGQEIVNEQTYSFTDRGGRQVVIRPEMTPSVSRMIAKKSKELSFPVRWYSLPNLWRYERPQKGRFREHWQLNVDIFGEPSIKAEIEIIKLASSIFANFGATNQMYQIRVNSRKFMDHLMGEKLGLNPSKTQSMIKLLDKKDKMADEVFKTKAKEILGNKELDHLQQITKVTSIEQLDEELIKNPFLTNLDSLIKTLTNDLNLDNVVYSPTLVRGFDYYSDIVFEIYDTSAENNRSMMGGGRYDGLVSLFGGGEIEAVGFGLGDATLVEFLKIHNLLPNPSPDIDLAILTVGDVFVEANQILNKLRSAGLNVVSEFSSRKVASKIQWAEKQGARFIAVVGEQEIKSQTIKLKELSSSKEKTLSIDEAATALKNNSF